jgi:hypothetical protein
MDAVAAAVALLPMTLAEYSALAQVVLTGVTFAGILVSMWLSVRALREVQVDRRFRQRPHLAFECGGNQLPVKFEKVGKAIPGVNPAFAEKAFAHLPDDVESVRLKRGDAGQPLHYGRLKNYGLGPGLSVSVTWVPHEIWIGSEKFTIGHAKLSEPMCHKALNTMPTTPSHILPGEQAQLSRLPTFIDKDFEKKIKRVDGVLEIACRDVFENNHTSLQEFIIFADYLNETPYVHVTFGDILVGERSE